MDEHRIIWRKCAGSYWRWVPGIEHLLDVPHDHELDDRDIHALVVENPASIRNLPDLSPNAGGCLEFCDF